MSFIAYKRPQKHKILINFPICAFISVEAQCSQQYKKGGRGEGGWEKGGNRDWGIQSSERLEKGGRGRNGRVGGGNSGGLLWLRSDSF